MRGEDSEMYSTSCSAAANGGIHGEEQPGPLAWCRKACQQPVDQANDRPTVPMTALPLLAGTSSTTPRATANLEGERAREQLRRRRSQRSSAAQHGRRGSRDERATHQVVSGE